MPHELGRPRYRLLMTADTVGGVWTYALDLARSLSEYGVDVTLVTLGPSSSDEQRREAATVARLELIETGEPLDWLCDGPAPLVQAAETISRLASSRNVDLIQLNGTALGGLTQFLAPVVVMHHSCLKTWWNAVKCGPLPHDWAWRSERTRQHLSAVAAVAAPTRVFAQATAAAYRLEAVPRAIHNGRPRPQHRPHQPPVDAILTAGRLWDEGKNVAALEQAASRVAAPIFAAGPVRGPNGAQIDLERMRALGLLSEDQLRDRLAERPIFASTALYEPFGLAILEAAQAGCALVLSDIPTYRELWQDAALFVDPRNVAVIAEAANALLADGAIRETYGAAARERAQRYSAQSSANATLAWHLEILGRRVDRSLGESAA